MTEERPIIVPDETGELASTSLTGRRFIGFELDILGQPASFNIAVASCPATLADIVPVARAVCDKITNTVTKKNCQEGGRIACHPGCPACCHYLVPLSVPEACRLVQEFNSMHQSYQILTQRAWLLTASRILSNRPPLSVVGPTTGHSPDDPIDLNAVSDWYRSLRQACPFLRNGLCTIYQERPLACREYFVKGSETACSDPHGTPERIQMPVRTTEILGRLASELERTSVEAVMLPLVLVWHTNNLQRAQRTWPAELMVERFVQMAKTAGPEDLTTLTRPGQTRIPIIEKPPATKSRPRVSQPPQQTHHDRLDSAVP